MAAFEVITEDVREPEPLVPPLPFSSPPLAPHCCSIPPNGRYAERETINPVASISTSELPIASDTTQ